MIVEVSFRRKVGGGVAAHHGITRTLCIAQRCVRANDRVTHNGVSSCTL